jgi:hypothetical protein
VIIDYLVEPLVADFNYLRVQATNCWDMGKIWKIFWIWFVGWLGGFIGRCVFVEIGSVNNCFMWCLGCFGFGYVVVLVMGRCIK